MTISTTAKSMMLMVMLFSIAFVSACSKIHVYQPDIQQGNLILEARADQLRVGMSASEVLRIMGHPVLENQVTQNHWAYVYTMQRRGGQVQEKRVDVFFQGGRVSRVEKKLSPVVIVP